MAAVVAAIVLVCFVLGYRYYAKFIGERIFDDREEITTPAHEFEDGQDFVPTNRHILFGHHFTSIAGAAPIIGPCVAAYWGWLPAVLWVVFGTIFMGAVHDFGALVASVREKGRSIADITGVVLNERTRVMFLCFVLVLSWLVLAVFAMAIAGLFVKFPAAVLPVNIEIIVAIVIGWLIYKRKVGALVPSLVALAILYLFVWLGTKAPLSFEDAGLGADASRSTWIILLFLYSSVASLLPVWLLLQPRDYINSHQLVVGLALLFAGLFWVSPDFAAPMLRAPGGDGAPPIFPMLFVTIACGAISGFHGLVSSGTTSKQIASMRDTRMIGFGGMLGEGSLALAATMAAVAGVAVAGLDWNTVYAGFNHTAGAAVFVQGGAAFLEAIGLATGLATTLMVVLVVSFAATTLDTATRIERFIITELGGAVKVAFLQNKYVATAIAVIPAIVLAMWKVPDAAGNMKQAGWVLWPIFGASNQMLAALTLMVLSLYFRKRGKNVLPLLIPMLFIMAVTLLTLFMKTREFMGKSDWLLLGITAIQLTLVVWMIVEGIAMVAAMRRERNAA